jgi:hypothetical protein
VQGFHGGAMLLAQCLGLSLLVLAQVQDDVRRASLSSRAHPVTAPMASLVSTGVRGVQPGHTDYEAGSDDVAK